MLHGSKLLIVAYLCYCNIIYAYGNKNQFPFINKINNFTIKYSNLAFDNVTYMTKTYKCPISIVSVLKQFYVMLVENTNSAVISD